MNLKPRQVRLKIGEKVKIYHRVIKYLTLFLVVPLLPLLIFIYLLVWLDHLVFQGHWINPLVTQKRLTQTRFFPIFKFKTLNCKQELTLSGRLLRTFYLDELPQIFNILRGDMVFVGPRPHPIEDYLRVKKSGFYSKRLMPAGLTGGVQMAKGTQRNGDLRIDEEYLHFCLNSSTWEIIKNDLEILWKTIHTVLDGKGLYFGG